MDYIYCLIKGNDWEDMVLFLSKDEAIEQSINYPNFRIEIFIKNNNTLGYTPTYNYYKNGEYIKNY